MPPLLTIKNLHTHFFLDEGVVRFFQQSPKQHELMMDLFEKTFDLDLVADGAYVAAELRGVDEATLDVLPTLEPTAFHAEGV